VIQQKQIRYLSSSYLKTHPAYHLSQPVRSSHTGHNAIFYSLAVKLFHCMAWCKVVWWYYSTIIKLATRGGGGGSDSRPSRL